MSLSWTKLRKVIFKQWTQNGGFIYIYIYIYIDVVGYSLSSSKKINSNVCNHLLHPLLTNLPFSNQHN